MVEYKTIHPYIKVSAASYNTLTQREILVQSMH